MARPRKIENTFDNRTTTTFSNPPGQSKGILADDVTRTVLRSREGTIEHTPTQDNHIVNKKYVDDNEVASMWEVDGSETQLKVADEIDMQAKRILNVTDPILSQDAATMKYVDDEVLPKIEWSDVPVAITFIIDGGGEDITTGRKGFLSIPFECTINSVTMLGDNAGSMVCDIWVDSYANHPPTDADSITAAAVPELDGADRSTDSTLTGWSKVISAGDVIAYNVDSVADLQYVTITLKATRSD